MSRELKVKLKSSDDHVFELEEIVAFQSQTIKDMVHNAQSSESIIPLQKVSSKIFSKVIEYCRYHALEVPKSGDDKPALMQADLQQWDADFLKVDQATLFDLVRAADYLKIPSLLDLTCQSIADMIKEKTPSEIREIFNIKEKFTPEEEEQIRRENPWAFK